jgi:hypothetical protein
METPANTDNKVNKLVTVFANRGTMTNPAKRNTRIRATAHNKNIAP